MHTQSTSVASNPTVDSAKDLFVLSDEQMLEIATDIEAPSGEPRAASLETSAAARQLPATRATEVPLAGSANVSSSTSHDSPEPPAWLAAQMHDAWGGEEAREFWDGVQQARSEAAAYRAAIATPEDARALKELYPGGVNEARTAAERARLLDEVDRAYFGAAGNSPEQLSASRTQLAQRMLREDPAAFREMVEAGVRVLQEASNAQGGRSKTLASLASETGNGTGAARETAPSVGAQHAAPQLGNQSANEAYVASYGAFERAANEDLERSVGAAIERTLTQALPGVEQHTTPGQARHGEQAGAQRAAPLRERLAASVRVDVEKALRGDRQLGEQVAQILAARRFDNESRAQIVRLISDRAQQLVPAAAKRVLNEWTQTTLAAHRGRTQQADAPSARAGVPAASVPARPAGDEQGTSRRQDAQGGSDRANTTKSRPINYRKFSDEQILEM